MTTRWTIETRLGHDPHSQPLRRRWIVARTEADALRLAALGAAAETAETPDQLLNDGQEEVFARAEFGTGPEHHAGEDVRDPDASAAAQSEGGGDR